MAGHDSDSSEEETEAGVLQKCERKFWNGCGTLKRIHDSIQASITTATASFSKHMLQAIKTEFATYQAKFEPRKRVLNIVDLSESNRTTYSTALDDLFAQKSTLARNINTLIASHPTRGAASPSWRSQQMLLNKNGGVYNDKFKERLIQFNNTPREDGFTPAAMFNGRTTRSLLPEPESAYRPINQATAAAAREHRADIAHRHYGKNTRPLAPLTIGQKVVALSTSFL